MAKSSTPAVTIPARRQTKAATAPAVPQTATTDVPDAAEVVENTSGEPTFLGALQEQADEMVTAIVPESFVLTRDNHVPIAFTAGVGEYAKKDVAHWYAKARGVKEYVKE